MKKKTTLASNSNWKSSRRVKNKLAQAVFKFSPALQGKQINTNARMLRRLAKHLQMTQKEVMEEAVKELYAFIFNE